MPSPVEAIQTLDELRSYIHESLCEIDLLEIDAFPMTERILLRNGQPCGMYFCLHGPRSVKLSAIWETERNTILFYGSNGQRHQRTQLVTAPALELVLA